MVWLDFRDFTCCLNFYPLIEMLPPPPECEFRDSEFPPVPTRYMGCLVSCERSCSGEKMSRSSSLSSSSIPRPYRFRACVFAK